MTLLLDSELEQLISDKLATDKYPSVLALLRESLRLVQEHDETVRAQCDAWQHDIEEGLQQIKEGRSVVLDEEVLASIKARGRARLAQHTQAECV